MSSFSSKLFFSLFKSFLVFCVFGPELCDPSYCHSEREKYLSSTKQVQDALFELNHPLDCSSTPILLCSTRVNKFQGTGSRLFFLGRCLAEGMNSHRVVVLSNELLSTHDILSPFKPWSNCTVSDLKISSKGSRIKNYYPMDSDSLIKSKDMPAVGALYPRYFARRGYWWWKAQEITYALRPKFETSKILEEKFAGIPLDNIAVLQIRRTDKTQGKTSGIKCKKEASAPRLWEFIEVLEKFGKDIPKFIQVVTDDSQISEEISSISKRGYEFLKPEPAPKRIPDKHGGIFKHRALKDALDIITMAYGNPFIFTYSSGFGALALQLKQVRENFCSNWSSLDWGKREWPPIGTISKGGVRGVKENSEAVSKICTVLPDKDGPQNYESYCSVLLKKSSLKQRGQAAVFSFCNCN